MNRKLSTAVAGIGAFVAGAFGQAPSPTSPARPHIADRVATISADRLMADLRRLETFGTRHTLSDATSDRRGVGAAARWLKEQLTEMSPDLSVSIEQFQAPRSIRLPDGAPVANVVAVLKGRDPAAAGRAYYVVGHYDSRNSDPLDGRADAPGANDDGSGTVAVLEAARVITSLPADQRPEATIVFLCTGAEEQGLLGAKFHAESVVADERYRVLGVLSNDIVGDPWGEHHPLVRGAGQPAPSPDPTTYVRLFSEGIPRNPSAEQLARIRTLGAESDSSSRQLARYVLEIADHEKLPVRPMLIWRPDRFLRGGDHSAFNDAGIAAVRFTAPFEDYTRQHVDVTQRNGRPYGDISEFVEAEYLANVTRVNVAALLHLANAPSPPGNPRIITEKLETSTTLRWEPSPETDVGGYEVVWRATTEPRWTDAIDAAGAREINVPLSKDNVIFGVRTYDRSGYRSPVVLAVDAKQ